MTESWLDLSEKVVVVTGGSVWDWAKRWLMV